jgi:ribosomal protein S18 acetylase RimI-like enzyme
MGGVRPALSQELDRVAALWTLLAEHHGGSAGFAAAPDAALSVRDHLAAALSHPDAVLLVAEAGGQLIGFGVARVLRRPALFAETARGEIEALFVREEARRSGTGRALARALLAWLAERGLARVALHVARGNAEGQAFWRALGFTDSMDVLERPL